MVKLINSDSDTPAKQGTAPRPRRRGLKFVLLSLFAVVFLFSGWFTYKISAATGQIFTENTTGGSPVLQGKKLKDDEYGRINILVMGVGGEGHDGPNLTDTVQVMSIDPKAKQVAMLSLPRDLYVQVPNSSQKVKLNEVHVIGEDNGAKGGGPGLLKEQVQTMLDVPIHYFARLDFEGFQQIVDTVGGVSVNVETRLYDPYYPLGTGYQVLDVPPGQQTMNGELALKYVRSRETTTDFDRSKRQQQVLVATRDKALSAQYLTNPGKVSQFISILGDHVKTDLSIGELQKLGQLIKDVPTGSINSKVLDNGETGLLYDSTGPGGAYILLPRSGDYTDIREFASQLFAGSTIQQEKAAIDLQNASGQAGLAAQEQSILSGYGYSIVGTGNAPESSPATTVIDYTNGAKPYTVGYLEKRFKGKVIKQTGPPGVDIRVIIGSSYSGSSEPASTDEESL